MQGHAIPTDVNIMIKLSKLSCKDKDFTEALDSQSRELGSEMFRRSIQDLGAANQKGLWLWLLALVSWSQWVRRSMSGYVAREAFIWAHDAFKLCRMPGISVLWVYATSSAWRGLWLRQSDHCIIRFKLK